MSPQVPPRKGSFSAVHIIVGVVFYADRKGSEGVEGPLFYSISFSILFLSHFKPPYETRILCVECQFKASDPALSLCRKRKIVSYEWRYRHVC